MSDTVESSKSSNQLSASLAVGLVCLVIGGALGYYTRYFMESPNSGVGAATPSTAGSSRMAGMGGGMGGGMMGGGGGGGMTAPGPSLARLVRNLATIQKVQGSGITPAQEATLLPILEQVKSAEKLPETEAQAKLDAINKTLTPEQKEALDAMQPRRGGGGGPGGGPGGPGGGGPGGPGGGGPMMGGMGGGSQDPEKPFASERNKQALDDLIANLKK